MGLVMVMVMVGAWAGDVSLCGGCRGGAEGGEGGLEFGWSVYTWCSVGD